MKRLDFANDGSGAACRIDKRTMLGVVGLALAFCSAAHAASIEQLLRLPLERLLQLEVSMQRVSVASGSAAAADRRAT